MEFRNPYILIAAILPLALFVFELVRQKARHAPVRFPAMPKRELPVSLKTYLRWLPAFLRFLVLSLFVVALAAPRVASDEIPIYKKGIDIVVAFDVSTSMKALDFEPSNRFTVAKNNIEKFVKGRKNDRVGLVVFAGEAYTQCPLTLDKSVLLNILQTIRMDVIADGTAIGDALATGINRLRDSQAKSKVIVLLTDGSNNRGEIEPEKAAMLAKEFDVKIYTVQVGKGGRVPYPSRSFDFLKGGYIDTVEYYRVPVNPELLRLIADETGGRFYVADDSEALEDIFEAIDKLEKTELPDQQFVMYEEIYASFLWPALVLLLLELALRFFWLRKFP